MSRWYLKGALIIKNMVAHSMRHQMLLFNCAIRKKKSYFGLLSPFVQFPDLFPNVDAELVSKSGSQARPDIVLSWYAAGRRRTKSGGLWSNGTNEDLGWSGLSKKNRKKIITATSVYWEFFYLDSDMSRRFTRNNNAEVNKKHKTDQVPNLWNL